MNRIFAIMKLSLKEHQWTWLAVMILNLIALAFVLNQKDLNIDSGRLLFYSVFLEVTFFLAFLLSIFSTSMSLPKELQSKKIHSFLSTPLHPMELLVGRILGSFSMATLQISFFMLLLWILIQGGFAPSLPSVQKTIFPTGKEIQGGFAKNEGGIYWAYRPKIKFHLHWSHSFKNFPSLERMDGNLLGFSSLKKIFLPTLNIRNIQITDPSSSNKSKIELRIEVHKKANRPPIIFQKFIQLDSSQTHSIPLPIFLFASSGNWKVTITQETLTQSLQIPFKKSTLFLEVPFFLLPKSQKLSKQNLYLSFPFSPEKTSPNKLSGSHLIWHFHNLENQSKPILIGWTPLLLVSNSKSKAMVAIGKTSNELLEFQEVTIHDNQEKKISFTNPKSSDLYFHIFWTDINNKLGVDFRKNIGEKQKNGAVLLEDYQSPWINFAKLSFLILLKILLVTFFAGVTSIFLSKYIVLLFALTFYLGGSNVPNMKEFSHMLLQPKVEEKHDEHSHGTSFSKREETSSSPSLWEQSLHKVYKILPQIFPDLNQYNLLNSFLYGHYIPSKTLWNGIYLLIMYLFFFLGIGGFLFYEREYL